MLNTFDLKKKSPSYLILKVFQCCGWGDIAIFSISNMKMFNVSALTCVLVLVVSRQTCRDTTLPGTVQKYFANLQFLNVKVKLNKELAFIVCQFAVHIFAELIIKSLTECLQKYFSGALSEAVSSTGQAGRLQTECCSSVLSRSHCLDYFSSEHKLEYNSYFIICRYALHPIKCHSYAEIC